MKRWMIFAWIFIIVFSTQYIYQLSAYTKIGAGELPEFYSSSHIFDCRENKTLYNQGHFRGAIYFDPKQFTKNRAEYLEESLNGIFRKNIIFYSGNDRIEKQDTGQIINWPGYYAQDITQYIEALPLYKDFTFYAVSEDMNIWLEEFPDWNEQEDNTLSHGTLTSPHTPTYGENLLFLLFMIIGIIILVCFAIFLVKTKINEKLLTQESEQTIVKKRKILIKELSNSLDQKHEQEKKKEFKLRRRK